MVEQCNSCKTSVSNLAGTARFPCPQCGKEQIIRCNRCRRLATKYKCHACGFEGPN